LVWRLAHVDSLVQVGPTEGFEVLKGSLCSHVAHLYSEVWNDQPPLHTWLLATLFNLFGPSMKTARALACGFGLLMCVSAFGVARRTGGAFAGWIACLTLLGSPEALRLCFAAMLEVSAMGVSLASVWAAFVWENRGGLRWLLLSGCLMGMALQIKFTAAIFVSALLADIVLFAFCGASTFAAVRWARAARAMAAWSLALLAAMGCICAAFQGWSLGALWFSHAAAAAELQREGLYTFSMSNLLDCVAWTNVGALFLLLPAALKAWRQFLFYHVLITRCFWFT
jgi:4-amino-4-deoxy-L-arabinose transferase-like glycosyltransferase